jgi:hypothetical protein
MPTKRSKFSLDGIPADQAAKLIKERVKLERELGREICGYPVWGRLCTFEVDHPDVLHSGDLDQGVST